MLYSYKMTHDTGFAPNPFHGVMTLATCKPLIRASRKEGTYIAGFTSKKLCGDRVGQERLVFLMKVNEVIDYNSYYSSEEFKCKIPSRKDRISKVGDNIYFMSNGIYKQGATYFHSKEIEIERDLKSDKVLISRNFFYFGVGAISIDEFKINIPRTQTGYGVVTKDKKQIDALWSYLENNYDRNCVINSPHIWSESEVFNNL